MAPTNPDRPTWPTDVILRESVSRDDCAQVRRIVEATRFFRDDEIEVAVELVEERLAKGVDSGYEFLFAEQGGSVVGYACYGQIACTLGSFDLYWIAVDPARQGSGFGRWLLGEAEHRIRNGGGRHIYIETSGRPQYAPTRAFYAACGYEIAATLADFYEDNDDKVIWRKVVT